MRRDAIDAFISTIGEVINATTAEVRNYETGNPDATYEAIVFGDTPEGHEALRLANATDAAKSAAGMVFSRANHPSFHRYASGQRRIWHANDHHTVAQHKNNNPTRDIPIRQLTAETVKNAFVTCYYLN